MAHCVNTQRLQVFFSETVRMHVCTGRYRNCLNYITLHYMDVHMSEFKPTITDHTDDFTQIPILLRRYDGADISQTTVGK